MGSIYLIMSKYYDRLVPVPTVKGITVSGKNKKNETSVFYKLSDNYLQEKQYTIPKRALIGYVPQDNPTKMYPNDNYRELFQKEWKEQFGDDIKPIVLKIGMYTATKAAIETTELRKILDASFGKVIADRLLDYAMFSILYQSDSTSQYNYCMSDQLLFNGKIISDSTYSELFEKGISMSDILQFKRKWAQQCKSNGIEEAWLCIDGSNEDCKSTGVDIAEKGKAKSKNNGTNIVSFTYAVSTNGKPITFKVYRGGLVDSKALKEIIDFLVECDIKVKGVILDRGYCNSKALRYLNDLGIEYLIMIKGDPQGYKEVSEKYKPLIKLNAEYLLLKSNLFAAQDIVQLFSNYDKQDYVTIFYDFKNAAERLDTYLKKVHKEIRRIEKNVANGNKPEIGEGFKDILELSTSIDNAHAQILRFNTENLQKRINDTGMYGIVHSENITPSQVKDMYVARSASEKQYTFIKTMLGYGSTRIQMTKGIHSKFTLGFISSIIRHEFMVAAKKIGRSTTDMIREMNLIQMERINKTYAYTHSENKRQIQFIKLLGKDVEYIDQIIKESNNRLDGYMPPRQKRKPGPKPKIKKTDNITANDDSPTYERKKPGPKPGYKRGITNLDGSVRKKPGPKPGTKRGKYNKDGTLRKRPGPKQGSHHDNSIAQ